VIHNVTARIVPIAPDPPDWRKLAVSVVKLFGPTDRRQKAKPGPVQVITLMAAMRPHGIVPNRVISMPLRP
jgi:hypothetical protein